MKFDIDSEKSFINALDNHTLETTKLLKELVNDIRLVDKDSDVLKRIEGIYDDIDNTFINDSNTVNDINLGITLGTVVLGYSVADMLFSVKSQYRNQTMMQFRNGEHVTVKKSLRNKIRNIFDSVVMQSRRLFVINNSDSDLFIMKATLDDKTTSHCRNIHNKVFNRSRAIKEANTHFGCRTIILPYEE